MKTTTNLNTPFSSVLFTLSLLIFIPLTGLIAGTYPFETSTRPGIVIFKVTPEYKVELPVEGTKRFGIAHIDRFIDDIGVIRVERTYPHCLPPIPGGTDLTRIYTLYFPEHLDVERVSADLEKLEGIEYTEPWYIHQLFDEPNDPRRDEQYALELLQAWDAHDITHGSPNVVIAITDNGMDMDHDDLVDNLWINPGEDLNGNRRIDDNERNNRDDDGNGHVDDFYGWDFPEDDNNPEDNAGHGHGTHTAGIASAVTNNGVGIASVAYTCRIMAVRAGRGQSIPYGYQSIEYAARNGAKVINCSWGGYRSAPAEREVINYAEEQDALVVAAAGNNNTTNRSYPAGYETVVAVAATNRNDRKAGFSNYGNWVDIAAPGVSILSTFLNNGYRSWEGTSMASPYVASVAGLLRSHYPEMEVEMTRLFLMAGVNNINDDRLGSGRVNAFRALEAMERPILEFGELILSSDENGNDRVDPGERAEFTITISNFGLDAEDIVAVLSTDDESIHVIEGEIHFPDLTTGERHTNNQQPFIIEIEEGTTPHTTLLYLNVTAQPDDIELNQEYEILIGHPAVLIVDDDGGGSYEEMFGEALRNINLGYQRWDVLFQDYLSWEMLVDHSIVIWLTGNSYPPLDNQERHAMRIAIEEGANIFLMGKWIGDMPENQPFVRQQFRVYHERDSVAADAAVGYPEGPVPKDLEILFCDAEDENDTLNATISPSSIRTYFNSDTLMLYSYQGEITGGAGSYFIHDNGSHVVYLGFNLEMANDLGTPRRSLVAHILDWMTDYRSTPLPEEPAPMSYMLDPAYPNPFNSKVLLKFSLPIHSNYRLSVINLMGREVAVLGEGEVTAGKHMVVWNANVESSGLYIARLSSPGHAPIEQRLILVK